MLLVAPPVTAEAWVQHQASLCDDIVTVGQVFLGVLWFYPVSDIIPRLYTNSSTMGAI
jgi:hypothetical protein